jgi:hypothetical protein
MEVFLKIKEANETAAAARTGDLDAVSALFPEEAGDG